MGNGIFAKIEGRNPAGSVKDRTALYIVMRGLESGALEEGGTVVEATSGNTGIALAYVGRELGLNTVICMPESMSLQRRAMISAYGAELVLTPSEYGMAGARSAAEKIVKERGAFLANQFGNTAGIDAHFETTAPELFAQVADAEYIVAGVGSGGTAMGFGKFIEENKMNCKVIAVEPSASPLMSEGYAAAHLIQGIGANFLPELVRCDKFFRIMTASDSEAIATTKEIYSDFDIKCGISSGAAYAVAKRLRKETVGKIAVIFPDNGDRYGAELYERN